MQKWEYKLVKGSPKSNILDYIDGVKLKGVDKKNFIGYLNELGFQGWEAVNHASDGGWGWVLFKRPIEARER